MSISLETFNHHSFRAKSAPVRKDADFLSCSSSSQFPLPLPHYTTLALTELEDTAMPNATLAEATPIHKVNTKPLSPNTADTWDEFVNNAAEKTSNFWLALDVVTPVVNNFQGFINLKNGLLLSALVPIVNLPLQPSNQLLLSSSPWGKITETLLSAVTWLPLMYSGTKEILTSSIATYQEAKQTTHSNKTAEKHAVGKGLLEAFLEVMALYIGPYALMSLSDSLISNTFYRSVAINHLANKPFNAIMQELRQLSEFTDEHSFIDTHQLTTKTDEQIRQIAALKIEKHPKLSNVEALSTKALWRFYNRKKPRSADFLSQLWFTVSKRTPVMAKELWRQLPKVLRNEMPERVDSSWVLAQLGEIYLRQQQEAYKLKDKTEKNFFKDYIHTPEFKLGSYKTISSLGLLATWYLVLDPVINKLANQFLAPIMINNTNKQLQKQGEPPFYPKGFNHLKKPMPSTAKTTTTN
jgi:hypothetical protein